MCDSHNIPLFHLAAEMGTLVAFPAPNSRIWEVETKPDTWGQWEGGREVGDKAELQLNSY